MEEKEASKNLVVATMIDRINGTYKCDIREVDYLNGDLVYMSVRNHSCGIDTVTFGYNYKKDKV